MNNLSRLAKPLPCNQKWDEMLPSENGRICQGCGKLVTDFRKQSRSEIEGTHRNSLTPVCGIYSDKQLNNWEQKTYFDRYNCSRFASISVALFALNLVQPTQIQAQSPVSQEQSFVKNQAIIPGKQSNKVISGTIYEVHPNYIFKPLKGAKITLYPDISLSAVSDSSGKFTIDINSQLGNLSDSITLIVSYSGFTYEAVKINKSEIRSVNITLDNERIINSKEKIHVGAVVIPGKTSVSYFYAQAPTETTKQTKKKWWQWKRKK